MQESHGYGLSINKLRVTPVSVSLMLVYPEILSPDVGFMIFIMILSDHIHNITNYPIHNITM